MIFTVVPNILVNIWLLLTHILSKKDTLPCIENLRKSESRPKNVLRIILYVIIFVIPLVGPLMTFLENTFAQIMHMKATTKQVSKQSDFYILIILVLLFMVKI